MVLKGSDYASIPNSNLAPPVFDVPPLSPSELQVSIVPFLPKRTFLTDVLQAEISYRTVKDLPQIKLQFSIPDQRENWGSQVSCFHQNWLGTMLRFFDSLMERLATF